MRVLTVPNWSFGRNKVLLRRFQETLEVEGVAIHFLESDLDHNRTVTALSGEPEQVLPALKAMSLEAFDTIDLNHHTGVHPRIGGLDVCPFIVLHRGEEALSEAQTLAQEFGAWIGEQGVPVFLYEKSARVGRESSLPGLRKAGFGGLIGRDLEPDFGPSLAHSRLGVSVVGVRDFLIALNCNLAVDIPLVAQRIAKQIRDRRQQGDERFLGVRALGFPLASRGMSQVSMNLTLPNLSPIDPIVEWIRQEAERHSAGFSGTELIGVIRRRDLEHCTTVYPRREQIVDSEI